MIAWVCRAGKNAVHIDEFIEKEKIFFVWDGFSQNLNDYPTRDDLTLLVQKEMPLQEAGAISRRVSQILTFRDSMQIGDIVISPKSLGSSYCIGVIKSKYIFDRTAGNNFYHQRKVDWLIKDLAKERLSKYAQRSLGAVNTVYKFTYENEILSILENIKNH